MTCPTRNMVLVRMKSVIVLACSVAIAGSGSACMAMARGVGPIPAPVDEEGARLALAAGGGQEVGLVQGTVGATYQAAEWFALDLSIVVPGVYAAFDSYLRSAQDLTMNWGLWPVASAIFYIGPVDLRLSLFGIGGGGPEGPAGYMGYAAGTLGLRIDDVRSLWAGFSAQAVNGCCETNYSGVSYQVPIGIVFDRLPLSAAGDAALVFALELLWARDTVGTGGGGDLEVDTLSLLLHVLTDFTG